MLAHDDVRGFDVPMQHPAPVGIVDRVADVEEPPQQLAQLDRATAGVILERRVAVKLLDGLLERIAANEPHGVIGPAVAVGTQPVHRHDAGMLEPPGDLGLEQKTLPADGVVRVVVEDLLERHLAVQLAVECDEDRPQPAPGVRPQDAEPPAVGCRHSDRVVGREVSIVAGLGRFRAKMRDGGLDLRIAQAQPDFRGSTD